ncbi:MAG: DNA internalization-related competence protein ComEC/Rec2 [Bacillota bacterium]|nr:DNA internalization-related competence protein ComEC/Rec2 [Bacillota bacterium]
MVRRPLIYVASAFMTAILVCTFASSTAALICGICSATFIMLCKTVRQNTAIIVIVYILSVLNWQIYTINDNAVEFKDNSKIEIIGEIVSLERKNSGQEKYIQMAVEADKINSENLKGNHKILVKYYGRVNDPIINNNEIAAPSDKVKIKGWTKLPSERRNPRCFDYALYLKSKGISILCEAESISVIQDENVSMIRRIKREIFLARERYLGMLADKTDEDTSAIMRGIMFGDKNEIAEEDIDNFRMNGTAHILAVSGMHVGIIYAVLNIVWPWKKNKLYFCFIMIFFIGYAFMASFSPSVIRAVCMIGLHIIASLTNRKYDVSSAAMLVFTAMLLNNPMSLFDAGFQMSFLAAMSIAVILPVIRRFYSGVLLGSIAVQNVVMPYTAYMFNSFSAVAVFINVPVVMLAGVIVPAGMCGFIMMFANSTLFSIPAAVSCGLCELLCRMNSLTAVKGATCFDVCSPNESVIIMYYMLILIFVSEEGRLIILRKKYGKLVIAIAAAAAVSLMFGHAVKSPLANADIIFADVGQGDCIHLRIRTGRFGSDGLLGSGLFTEEKNYLIDGGGKDDYNVGKKILKPYLLKNGVKKLDGVFVTHLHTDHYKGVAELCREGMVKKLYLYEANRCKENIIVNETGIQPEDIEYLYKGSKINFDGGKAEILWPERATDFVYKKMLRNETAENDLSLVIKVSTDDIDILITGDMDKQLMDELAENERLLSNRLKCDVLKVPHHGSKYSWSSSFIKATAPEYAVIQVGKNNYGHPAEEILDKYNRNNIEVRRNDKEGAIGVFRDSESNLKIISMLD